jgi:hypothetical protein
MRIRISRGRRRSGGGLPAAAALVCLLLLLPISSVAAASASASSSSAAPTASSTSLAVPAREEEGAPGSSSLSSAAAGPAVAETAAGGGGGGKNVVAQLAGYVRDSVAKTADGCGQLWRNHGRCNDIRGKVAAHREKVRLAWEEEGDDDGDETAGGASSLTPRQKSDRLKTLVGGISYEEFVFLQRGKDDRSKVFNLLFLMWGAPRFLPYALMFNPEMLPSPFREASTGDAVWTSLSRGRSAAVVRALLDLESEAHRAAPAWARFNVLSRTKPEDAKLQLLGAIARASDALGSGLRPPAGARRLLSDLRPHLYRDGSDFTRAERRLCRVPKPLVRGVNGVLNGGTGGGVLAALQPHFMTRGRVIGHIRKVAETDDFLVSNSMNLTSIPKKFLQEACSERLMGVLGLSSGELRQQLADWLALASPSPDSGEFYNDNVARLALMGYYSCWAARGDQSSLQLPPLLYKVPPSAAAVAPARRAPALPPANAAEKHGASEKRHEFSSALKRPLLRFLPKR